jgi:hypothetical protein
MAVLVNMGVTLREKLANSNIRRAGMSGPPLAEMPGAKTKTKKTGDAGPAIISL